MEVRIGTTPEGRSAGFDSSSARPLILVGETGRGKTTVARYLTRWWLADTMRHAHVCAREPSEWADLHCDVVPAELQHVPGGGACRPGTCLVVVDDIDTLDDDQLDLAAPSTARVIWTSYGGNLLTGRRLLDTDSGALTCLGLVRPEHADPSEAAVLEGQGRLDWPIGTIAVIPDQRGAIDFPRHRWQTPVREHVWQAVAR